MWTKFGRKISKPNVHEKPINWYNLSMAKGF